MLQNFFMYLRKPHYILMWIFGIICVDAGLLILGSIQSYIIALPLFLFGILLSILGLFFRLKQDITTFGAITHPAVLGSILISFIALPLMFFGVTGIVFVLYTSITGNTTQFPMSVATLFDVFLSWIGKYGKILIVVALVVMLFTKKYFVRT